LRRLETAFSDAPIRRTRTAQEHIRSILREQA